MDAQAAQTLAAVIQTLTATAAALPAAPPAPAAPAAEPPLTSPYEGYALDLLSHLGAQLFCDGCTPLSSKFMGKVDVLQLFLADLKNWATMCHWDHPIHGILTFTVLGTTFHLLDDYRKLTGDQIEVACTA